MKYKKFNKKKILLLFILILLFIIIYRKFFFSKIMETFEDRLYIPNDPYDKQYVDMYEIVWSYDDNVFDDIKKINDFTLETIPKKMKKNIKILDGGCGIGAYTNAFKLLNFNVIGVDKSKNMLRKAMIRAPKCKFIRGDLVKHNLFKSKEFSHIYLGINVLNMNSIKDINKILKNTHYWLKNDGYLIVHILDTNHLQFFPQNYSQIYFDNHRNKHSFTYFKNFLHDMWLMKDKEGGDNKYKIYEKVVLKNGKSRIKVTNLIIPPREKFIELIEKNGFKLDKIVENRKTTFKGNDLTIFKKINK